MTVSYGRPSASAPRLRGGLPGADEGGPFEHPSYVRASAEHEGTEPVVLDAGGGRLVLLAGGGSLHTVYGYPQPVGAATAVADALAAIDVPLRVALSPLGAGGELAQALRARLPLADERAICVTDLDSDPMEVFDASARSMVRRALREGSSVEVGAVRSDFGPMYRRAMDAMGAADLYRFSDAYMAAMGSAGAFQVTVMRPLRRRGCRALPDPRSRGDLPLERPTRRAAPGPRRRESRPPGGAARMRAPRCASLPPRRRAQRRSQGRPAALQVRHEHSHADASDLLHGPLTWCPSSAPALHPRRRSWSTTRVRRRRGTSPIAALAPSSWDRASAASRWPTGPRP